MQFRFLKKSLVGFFFISCATQVAALANEHTAVENVCEQMAAKYEIAAGIPDNILHGIVRTESTSHPWTVNFKGEGFYFDTKNEAVDFVQSLIDRGFRSIDVGCAQINLKWHPDAFANLEDAFDPDHNLAYAAEFLTTIRYEYGAGDWYASVGRYHNANLERGRKYANIVYRKINLAPPQRFVEEQFAKIPVDTVLEEPSVRISTRNEITQHDVSQYLAPHVEDAVVAISDPTYFLKGVTFEQLVFSYQVRRVSQMDGVIGNMKK